MKSSGFPRQDTGKHEKTGFPCTAHGLLSLTEEGPSCFRPATYAQTALEQGIGRSVPDSPEASRIPLPDSPLGKRFGFINANLRLVGVDDSAVDLLYEASRAVCAYSEEGLRRIGFGDGAAGVRVRTPAQLAGEPGLFFDMRHVSRAFEQLGGESVRRLAEEQYDRGWHRRRQQPRRVKLVGDPARGRIVRVDVQETNGQAHNGRPEAAV